MNTIMLHVSHGLYTGVNSSFLQFGKWTGASLWFAAALDSSRILHLYAGMFGY
jgi:hypothetical protein